MNGLIKGNTHLRLLKLRRVGAAFVVFVVAIMALTVGGATAALAATPLVNESFEGDLSGWSVQVPEHGFAGAVTSFDASLPAQFGYPAKDVQFYPVDGAYFALLKTNGAGSYTTLSQTFSADAGATISGWAFFNTTDFYSPPYNDNAQVYIYKDGSLVATVFDQSVLTVGDRGDTPWTYWSYTFPSAETYTVQARVANTSDAAYDSHLGLDGVEYNRPPTAVAGGPYSMPEGSSVALSGSASVDPDGDPLAFAWDLDNDGVFETAGQSPTFSAAGIDGPSAQTVVLRVCDPSNACDTDSSTVNVVNVAPTADAGGSYTVDEGSSVVLSGAGSDPGPDALTYSWDLDNDGSFETAGQTPTFSAAGLDGPSTHLITLQVCDPSNACATDSGAVEVVNVAPTADAGGPYSVDEGSSVVLSGAGSDPGPDTLTYSWDLDNDGSFETAGQTPTFSAAGLDGPSAQTVVLQVCDDDGACATSNATVSILDVVFNELVVANSEAEDAIESLMTTVEGLGLPRGTENALLNKLDKALDSLKQGDEDDAVDRLNAFSHQVKALKGKKIGASDADDLIASAQEIISTIIDA